MPRVVLLGEELLAYCTQTSAISPTTGRPVFTWGTWQAWRGTVGPLPGEVLNTLPEGERKGKQLRILSSDTELQPTDDDTGALGALLLYEGEVFQVRDAQRYRRIIPHIAYRARRLLPAELTALQYNPPPPPPPPTPEP